MNSMPPLNMNHLHLGSSEKGALQTELAMNRITDEAWQVIQNSVTLEQQIHADIVRLSREKSHEQLERHTWWVECADLEDLDDEYAINKKLYNELLIEGQIALQRITSGPVGLYGINTEKYVTILNELIILVHINKQIQRRLEPPSFV